MDETFYKLENKQEDNEMFKSKERKHRALYYTICILMVLSNLASQLTYKFWTIVGDLLSIGNYALSIGFLTVSYVRIRKYFVMYHRDKFQIQNKELLSYFIFEITGYSLWIIYCFVQIFDPSNIPNTYFGATLELLFPFI